MINFSYFLNVGHLFFINVKIIEKAKKNLVFVLWS